MQFTTKKSLFSKLQNEGVLKVGRALDLGCNMGKDAKVLAEAGFTVDAVDKDAEAIESIKDTKGNLDIHAFLAPLQKFDIPKTTYSLSICHYVLHFLSKEESQKIITNMVYGCIEGGLVSFTVLGEKDEWKGRHSTWTKEEIENLLASLPVKILKNIEEDEQAKTKAGPLKWWHVRTYVVVKK